MLALLLILFLLSLILFCYTNHTNIEGLDTDPLHLATQNAANIAALSSQINGFTDIKKGTLLCQNDVKSLTAQINNLASLQKRSLQNAADIASLSKQIQPLIQLKQTLANLMVKVNTNSQTILKVNSKLQSYINS